MFGFAGLFGQWLDLSPVSIVLGRTLVASAVLVLVALGQRIRWPPDRGLAANGVVLAIHWTAFYAAVQLAGVAIALLGYATFPLFVLVLERLLLGRRWSASEGATALLVVTGLTLLPTSFDPADASVQGLGWGLLAGFTFALLAVRARRQVMAHPPVAVALWQNAFAAMVLLPLVWLDSDSRPALSPRDAGLIVILGAVCTAFAHTLFIGSLRRLSAHTASVVAALEPVYGIALAAWLLHEIPTPRMLAGAAIIVGAALMASRRHT